MPYRVSKDETRNWLQEAMEKNQIQSLDELSQISGIDAGSISRYFNLDRRPSIDAIEPLAIALKVRPEVLMQVLGATGTDYDFC